jgi:hypothetical protein
VVACPDCRPVVPRVRRAAVAPVVTSGNRVASSAPGSLPAWPLVPTERRWDSGGSCDADSVISTRRDGPEWDVWFHVDTGEMRLDRLP